MTREEVIEACAEAAHEAWLREKRLRLQNLRPAVRVEALSWPSETGEEQLVPWAELSEGVRDFDRIVVRAIMGLIEEAAGAGLTLREFHERCVPAKRPLDSQPMLFWACGLGEEAGEVLGVVKKATHREIYETGTPGEQAAYDQRLLEEAGNVLFYLRQVLEVRGLSLEQAARVQLDILDGHELGDR